MAAFSSIERLLQENGLPVPTGHGREKLDAIEDLIKNRENELSEDLRERLRNLIACCR